MAGTSADCKLYRERNKDKVKKYQDEYYAKNKEARKAYKKQYYAENREKYAARYRAKRAG